MAIMQVNIPERKPSGFSQLLNMGSQGASMWSAGQGIAGLFGGGAAAGGAGGAAGGSAGAGYGLGVTPFTPATEGMSPVLGGGQLQPVSSGAEGSSGGGLGAAGGLLPVGAYAAGMMQLDAKDRRFERDRNNRNSNAQAEFKQTEMGKNTREMSQQEQMDRTGRVDLGLTANPNEEKSAAIQRRMDNNGKKEDQANILMNAKSSLANLNLDNQTKQLIGKKLDLGLSQLFKLKA